MNKKERQKALFCTLSDKLRNKQLIVVDTLSLPEIKTKSALEIYANFSIEKKALVALAERNVNIEKSTNNIKNIKVIQS